MKPSFCFSSFGFLLGATLMVNAQAPDLRQGLVAYWPLDANDGGSALDATPFGNALVISGNPTVEAGRFNNAFTFDGATTYLNLLHSTDNSGTGLPIYGAGGYTVTMWVKGAAQQAKYLFSHGNTADQDPLLLLQTGNVATNNAKFDVIIRNDTGGALVNHVVSTAIVFDNTWHHIAFVDERGSARLYVDGQLDPANFNYVPAGVFTFNNTSIGTLRRSAVSTGAIFNGQIDDTALWERALTQAEVQQVMTNSIATPIPVLPPFITAGPASFTRAIGDRVTLSVRAVGNRPLSYQWLKGEEEILNATGPSLTLSNLVVADSGNYSVRVSNAVGSVDSSAGTLTVLPDPTPDVRRGLISHWSLDVLSQDASGYSTPDLYSHNDMKLVTTGFFDSSLGVFGNAILFEGFDQHGLRQGGFPIYNNPAFSISLWVNANGVGQSDRRFFSESSTNSDTPLFNLGTHATGVDGTIRVFIRNDASVAVVARNSTKTALDGTWHHVVWTETNGQAKLYIDGELDPTDFSYVRGPLTVDQTSLAAIVRKTVSSLFTGSLDDVAVWNRVVSFTEIQDIRLSGIPAPVGVIPPEITQNPVSRSVLTRSRVTFGFTATGTGPLATQWRKGGANLPNETNATLVFNEVALGDAGDYDVVVTNSAGGATSLVATLTVTLRPPPPTDLRVDFNNTGVDDNAANTEAGFTAFSIPSPGVGPFTRSIGGADVTLTAIGTTMESRKRGTPVNGGSLTIERIYQDFVFTRDADVTQGLDVAVEFLETNVAYRVDVWSFDSGSTTPSRISDWTANGMLVNSGYNFLGSELPTTNDRYRFNFNTVSDANGRILLQARRNAAASGGLNVFLNALTVVKRELSVKKIEYINSELVLTLDLVDPAATHELRQKVSLDDPEWLPTPEAFFIPPVGYEQKVFLPTPDTATRFYRAVRVP